MHLSTHVRQRRYSAQGKCVCTERTLGLPLHEAWETDCRFQFLFPHSCPHKKTPTMTFWHHHLWNLADSSAGSNTNGYVNLTTKQLPNPPWLEAQNDFSVSNLDSPTWQQHLSMPDPQVSAIFLALKVCNSRMKHFTTWHQNAKHQKGDKDSKINIVSW